MMWLVLWLASFGGSDGWVVVTSDKTPVDQLSAWQLKQIYFGRLDRMKGMHLVALHLPSDDALRIAFERAYLGEAADIEDYWLGEKLKGGGRRPLEVGGWALILAYVRRNPGFIGYIPQERQEEALRQGLKVVSIQ